MNQVMLVGRLAQDPEVKELDDGTFRTVINIAITRDYKNQEGIYEADFIKVILWNDIANATKNYCHKGDTVGIRGKLVSRTYEDSDKKRKHILEVVAEKITFLSSTREKNA